jgi:hypothetical protein
MASGTHQEEPRVLSLDPEALRSWRAYQQALESRMAEDGDLASIIDWAAKLSGAVLRLAALAHVVEHGSENRTISKETLERTLDLADLLIQHALCAFGAMGSDERIKDAQYVAGWIKRHGQTPVKQNDIHRGCDHKIPDANRLVKALGILVERHIISDAIVLQTGGRPSIVFHVNPEFLGGRS